MLKLNKVFLVMGMAALLIFAGCSDDDNPVNPGTPAATMDIVETAVAAGNFNTLVTAVQAAGLVDALKGEGPLTVFAPTDDAFAALPPGTIEALLDDTDALSAILLYHVVRGDVRAEQVVNLQSAETLNGQSVDISLSNGNVMIDNANVIITDIICTNGVIHVIDAVILPQ